MNFNTHSNLIGKHAFLSASNYHWVNYDEEKLRNTYLKYRAAEHGTELHDFAAQAIRLGIKLTANHNTLNMYVNDAIRFHMTPEQSLFYSYNAFGTADSICYNNKTKTLRIHDLKTGETKASFLQLEIYAALFCLEYHVDPEDLELIELRIYQFNDVAVEEANPNDIREIMNIIVNFDEIIDRMEMGGMYE